MTFEIGLRKKYNNEKITKVRGNPELASEEIIFTGLQELSSIIRNLIQHPVLLNN